MLNSLKLCAEPFIEPDHMSQKVEREGKQKHKKRNGKGDRQKGLLGGCGRVKIGPEPFSLPGIGWHRCWTVSKEASASKTFVIVYFSV